MSKAGFEEIAPYLHPDYWDGHSIGYGPDTQTTPPYLVSSKPPLSRTSLQGFMERIATMQRVVPIRTVGSGETFDPSDHSEGTLVMFSQETLRGAPKEPSLDMENLKEQQTPVRPTNFSLSFGTQSSPFEFLVHGPINYTKHVMCGVIDKRNGKEDEGLAIHAVQARLVVNMGEGRAILAGALFRTYPNPVHIGETTHQKTETTEVINRVNLLEVIAYGARSKAREHATGALGRLSFRPQNS